MHTSTFTLLAAAFIVAMYFSLRAAGHALSRNDEKYEKEIENEKEDGI